MKSTFCIKDSRLIRQPTDTAGKLPHFVVGAKLGRTLMTQTGHQHVLIIKYIVHTGKEADELVVILITARAIMVLLLKYKASPD